MTIIQQLQNKQVQTTLKEHGIVHLWIFGSHAKGINNEDSDIDLLYEHNYTNGYKGRGVISAYSYLEDLFHRSIDFVHIDNIHPLIKDEVLTHKQQVF